MIVTPNAVSKATACIYVSDYEICIRHANTIMKLEYAMQILFWNSGSFIIAEPVFTHVS